MILFSVPLFFPFIAAAASSDTQRRFELVFPHNRECFDEPGFRDDFGDGCDWYNSDSRCERSEEWASGPHGSAQMHCCKCGGGNWHAHGISYNYIPGGCVREGNLEIYEDKSVAECSLLCEEDLRCHAFEYGAEYPASTHSASTHVYAPRDCQLQYTANFAGCDGKKSNLDLYVKQGTLGSWCANEGEECECSGTVYYGRRNHDEGVTGKGAVNFLEMINIFNFKTKDLGVGGKVECTNEAMGGDPERKQLKQCFCEPDSIKELEAESYEFVSRGCVSGHTLVQYHFKTIEECTVLCDQNPDCLAFKYWTLDTWQEIQERMCELQSSADYETHHCDVGENEVDLYIKPAIPLPESFPEVCRGPWNTCFKDGDCKGIIVDANQGFIPRCGDNGKCTDLLSCWLDNEDLNDEDFEFAQKPERCLGLYKSCALDSVCVEAIHQMERPLNEVTCTPGDSKCSALLQCYNRAERPGPQIGGKKCGMGLHSILDEDDCRLAAGALGLKYGGHYNWARDRPGCMYMGTDTIYFNTASSLLRCDGGDCATNANAVCLAQERSFEKVIFKTEKHTCHKDQLLRKECHEGKPCTYDECSKLCDWNKSCTHFGISSTGICKTFTSCDDVDETGNTWETYTYTHPTPETAKCSTRLNQDVKAGTFNHHDNSRQTGVSSDNECRELCKAASGCTAWVRQPSTNTCWLTQQTGDIVFEAESDRNSGLMCSDREPYILEVGSRPGTSHVAYVEVPYGVVCPSEVSADNWLGGHTYGDIFEVSMSNAGTITKQALAITRVDKQTGWGMDLRFECFWAPEGPVACSDYTSGFCPAGETCECHGDCRGNWGAGDKNKNDAHCSGGGPRLTAKQAGLVACSDYTGGFCSAGETCECHGDCRGNWGAGDKNKNDAHCSGGGPRLMDKNAGRRRLSDGGKAQHRLLKLEELHAPIATPAPELRN